MRPDETATPEVDPTGAPHGSSPEADSSPRAQVLFMGLGWGLLLGLIAGAVAGTAIAPVLGTAFGAILGLAAAVAPSVVGAIALWLAARPGTSAEAFRTRVRWILTAIGAVVGAVALWTATAREWDEAITGPVAVGCLVAISLLPRANRSIGAVEPAPPGAPRGPERAALGLLLAIVIGALGWFGWTRFVGPDARARREVVGERDRIGRVMGLSDLYGYGLVRGAKRTECRPADDGTGSVTKGYVSYGGSSLEYGDLEDARAAVEEARRDLVARGYVVSRQERPQVTWVYGRRGDRSVTIEGPGNRPAPEVELPDDDAIRIRVADGCPEPQPLLETAPAPDPTRLLAAGPAPASGVDGLECPDGEPAQIVTVLATGWLGEAADGPEGWTLTTGSGRAVRPCDLDGEEDTNTVHALLVPASDDPVVRVEAVVEVFDEVDGSDGLEETIRTERTSVAVAPPDAPARAIVATLPPPFLDDLPSQDLTSCPPGTVQGVEVRWDRPLLAVDEVDGEALRTAAPEVDYRVTIERDGRTHVVTPTAVDGVASSTSTYVNATGQLLCLDEPGRPVRVRGAASDQLDLGGPPTEAFDLSIPKP